MKKKQTPNYYNENRNTVLTMKIEYMTIYLLTWRSNKWRKHNVQVHFISESDSVFTAPLSSLSLSSNLQFESGIKPLNGGIMFKNEGLSEYRSITDALCSLQVESSSS